MARKSKSSPVEDLAQIVALMPWWVGCVLALFSYLILHRIANSVVSPELGPGQIAGTVSQMLIKTFAGLGEIFVPIICLIGAAMSAYGRKKRRLLVSNVANSNNPDSLNGMSWREFELLVGEAFRMQGYQVGENGGGGADGGIDLVLRKDNQKFLVQCKQWKAFSVGVGVIRELFGVMTAKGASGGFVVTSGYFTEEAKHFARDVKVTLIDGAQLYDLIAQVKESQAKGRPSSIFQESPHVATPTTPACPLCTHPMKKRTAKVGSRAGSYFWGCSTFPRCRGTRQIG